MQCPVGLGQGMSGMIGGGIYCLPASELPRRASLTASVRYHSTAGTVLSESDKLNFALNEPASYQQGFF